MAYDGSGFHGFALNEGVATVAGALSEAIGTVLGCPATLPDLPPNPAGFGWSPSSTHQAG